MALNAKNVIIFNKMFVMKIKDIPVFMLYFKEKIFKKVIKYNEISYTIGYNVLYVVVIINLTKWTKYE